MGTADLASERVQALLKADLGSGSLQVHLCRVIRKIVDEKPDDALNRLEELSRQLKQASFRAPGAVDKVVPSVPDPEAEEKMLAWCSQVTSLIRPPSGFPEGSCKVRDFMEDSAMFEWAGIGFGKEESYRISMSLRAFAASKPGLLDIRIWGKMLGRDADYYVAEGTLPLPEGPTVEPQPGSPDDAVEPRGVGCNLHTYWICKSADAPWQQLPAVKAEHIVAARKIKQVLRGDPGAQVLSMPWFPGTEKDLLRAQIARISAASILAPNGWYQIDDEDTSENPFRIKEVEDPIGAFPPSEDLEQQGTWVHSRPIVLPNGKISWPNPASFPEGSNEAKEAERNREDEPPLAVLSSIDQDHKGDGEGEGSPAWSIKVFGDKSNYKFGEDTKSNRVTAVRSLVWPGAVAVVQGTKFANIYVGYGLKCGTLVPPRQDGLPMAGTSPFWPLAPDDVMNEPVDLVEVEEPHPLEDDAESDGNQSVDGEEGG